MRYLHPLAVVILSVGSIFIAFACQNEYEEAQKTVVIPSVDISPNDPNLRWEESKLYYHDQLFSGRLTYRHEGRNMREQTSYYEGVLHGKARRWHPNGQLKSYCSYEHGAKTGKHKFWWQDGTPKREAHYQDGLYDGIVREWYRTGQLYKQQNFKAGEEFGHQRIWSPQGKLIENYHTGDKLTVAVDNAFRP